MRFRATAAPGRGNRPTAGRQLAKVNRCVTASARTHTGQAVLLDAKDRELARVGEQAAVGGPQGAVLLEEPVVDEAGLKRPEDPLVGSGGGQRLAEVDRQVDRRD